MGYKDVYEGGVNEFGTDNYFRVVLQWDTLEKPILASRELYGTKPIVIRTQDAADGEYMPIIGTEAVVSFVFSNSLDSERLDAMMTGQHKEWRMQIFKHDVLTPVLDAFNVIPDNFTSHVSSPWGAYVKVIPALQCLEFSAVEGLSDLTMQARRAFSATFVSKIEITVEIEGVGTGGIYTQTFTLSVGGKDFTIPLNNGVRTHIFEVEETASDYFLEYYHTNIRIPISIRVQRIKIMDDSSHLRFQGHLMMENATRNWLHENVIMDISATDGLRSLENTRYKRPNDNPFYGVLPAIKAALAPSGHHHNIAIQSSLRASGDDPQDKVHSFLTKYFKRGVFLKSRKTIPPIEASMSCYDVLDNIMRCFYCQLRVVYNPRAKSLVYNIQSLFFEDMEIRQHVLKWSDFSAFVYPEAPQNRIVDISNMQVPGTVELQIISSKKLVKTVSSWKTESEVQGSMFARDPNDASTYFYPVSGTYPQIYSDRIMFSNTGGTAPVSVKSQAFKAKILQPGIDFLRVRIAFHMLGLNNVTGASYVLKLYKNGQDQGTILSGDMPLTTQSIVADTGLNPMSILKLEEGARYELRYTFSFGVSNPIAWGYTIQARPLAQCILYHPIDEDNTNAPRMVLYEDYMEIYRTEGEDDPAILSESTFGDTEQYGDTGCVYSSEIGNIPTYWFKGVGGPSSRDNIVKREECRNVMSPRFQLSNIIIPDKEDIILPSSVIKIVRKGVARFFRFSRFSKNLRNGHIDCVLEQTQSVAGNIEVTCETTSFEHKDT